MVMDLLGLGNTVDEASLNHMRVIASAKRYGLPETYLLGLLANENPDGKTDPGGNGGGMFQFTTDTAKAYGVTQDQLRKDPALAADLGARLFKDNMDALGGDPVKAAAAHYVGAGTIADAVKQGGENWLAAADRIAEQKGYTQANGGVTPSQYVAKIAGPGGMRPSQIGGSSSPSSPSPTGPGGYQEPKPADFPLYDDQGRVVGTDVAKYNAARQAWQTYTDGKDTKNKDFASYLDAAINQIGNEIEAGNMDVAKASGEFKRRMDAYDTASKNYTSMLGYGVPLGAKTIPGTSIDISGPGQVQEWNPFAEASNLVNGTPNLTSFQTPDASSGRVMTIAQQLYNMVNPQALNTAQQFAGGAAPRGSAGAGVPPSPTGSQPANPITGGVAPGVQEGPPAPPPAPQSAQRPWWYGE